MRGSVSAWGLIGSSRSKASSRCNMARKHTEGWLQKNLKDPEFRLFFRLEQWQEDAIDYHNTLAPHHDGWALCKCDLAKAIRRVNQAEASEIRKRYKTKSPK